MYIYIYMCIYIYMYMYMFMFVAARPDGRSDSLEGLEGPSACIQKAGATTMQAPRVATGPHSIIHGIPLHIFLLGMEYEELGVLLDGLLVHEDGKNR